MPFTAFGLPAAAYEQQGFDAESDKIQGRRVAIRDSLQKIADAAGAQGKTLTYDDLAQNAKSLLGPTDFLTSVSPSQSMLNVMLGQQNAQAQQVATDRANADFTTQQNQMDSVRKNLGDMALSGSTPEELGAYVQQNHPTFANKIIPQIGGIITNANVNAHNSGYTLGNQFDDLPSAQAYIDANPTLTASMKQGILNRAKEKDADIQMKVFNAAKAAADTNGLANEDQARAIIESQLPNWLYANDPPKREAIIKKALDTAKAQLQAKQTGDAARTAQIGADSFAQNEIIYQGRVSQAQLQDKATRDASAELAYKNMMGQVENQKQFLAQLEGKTGKDKMPEPVKQQLNSILSQYIVDDKDALLKAINAGDSATIERIKQSSRPISVVMERARQLSQTINHPEFYKDYDTAADAIGKVADHSAEAAAFGQRYAQFANAAGPSPSAAAAAPSGAVVANPNAGMKYVPRVGWVPDNGSSTAVTGGRGSYAPTSARGVPGAAATPQPGGVPAAAAPTKEQSINSMHAQNIRSSFIQDAAEDINARHEALVEAHSFNATKEQVQSRMKLWADQYANKFVAGMKLPEATASALAEKLSAEILQKTRASSLDKINSAYENEKNAYESVKRRYQTEGNSGQANQKPMGYGSPSWPTPAGGAPSSQWWGR